MFDESVPAKSGFEPFLLANNAWEISFMKAVLKVLTFFTVVAAAILQVPAQTDKDQEGNLRNQAAAPAAAEAGPGGRDERYRIGFQDTLEVQVFRHPELTQRVNVNPNGTIFLPRMEKPMVAVCKTERELATDIAEEYKSFLNNPFVTVVVADQRSQSFGVIGAVEKPGNFFVNRKIHLLELLSFAGGPSKEAGSRLIVARTGSSAACRAGDAGSESELAFLNFKIRDLQEGKKNLWMSPGDIVTVLDADLVYVYGNVNKQGEVRMKEALTLRQAIVTAEGFSAAAQKDRIRVLRQTGDTGEWEEFIFNLKEIDTGRIKDPVLLPNDIVAVSEDRTKSILQGLARSLSGGLGNLPVILR
jgi:polysaccharide biosynthesis/export protein